MKSYELVSQVSVSEPRIENLRKQILSLLSIVDFENKGEKVEIDGFKLKNIEQWLINLPNKEFLPYIESMSSRCPYNCKFCFENGNSGNQKIPHQTFREDITFDDIERRMFYHKKDDKLGLPCICSGQKEPFSNKYAVDIYEYLHEHYPSETIRILTAGSGLSENNIKRLSNLKPIVISVSLNSTCKEYRQNIMGDKNPEEAIESIKHLNDNKIIFMGTLVEWPEEKDIFSNLYQSIKYLSEQNAFQIKVYPFGFTKYYKSSNEIEYNTKLRYKEIFDFVKKLRKEFPTPILIDPLMHDDLQFKNSIEGIVKNSPANFLGLQIGDKIISVNDKKIISNSHLSSIMLKYENIYLNNDCYLEEDLFMEIMRENKTFVIDAKDILNKLNKSMMYPYITNGYTQVPFKFPLGMYLPYPFKLEYFKKMHQLIELNESTKPLLITSELMIDTVKEVINRIEYFENKNLYIVKGESTFWGGNICIGDLLMAEDYLFTIEKFINDTGIKPDLILIPSSGFSVWKKDLRGESINSISYKLNIKIELIPVEQF